MRVIRVVDVDFFAVYNSTDPQLFVDPHPPQHSLGAVEAGPLRRARFGKLIYHAWRKLR
jgi:hypothetical protein